MTPPEILAEFESLGDSCEFGFVQRHYALEPTSLLRWVGAPLDGLVSALIDGFAKIFRFEDLVPVPGGSVVDAYRLAYHSDLRAQEDGSGNLAFIEAEEVKRAKYKRESLHFRFLRRITLENLELRRKIFIYKRNSGLGDADILRLKSALDLFGPQRLLCVVPATPEQPAGRLDLVASGVQRVGMTRLACYGRQEDTDVEGWLDICQRALASDWAQPDFTAARAVRPAAAMIEPADAQGSASFVVDRRLAAALVTAAYRTVLLREPDPPGLVGYTEDTLRDHRTIEDVFAGVFRSEEFARNAKQIVAHYAGTTDIE